jgi:hypothetical protein
MWEDPIVAEVREIREKLAAKFGFDVKAIFADLRKRQGSLGARLILQKNEQNQRLKLTGAAILLPRNPRPRRRPRQFSRAFAGGGARRDQGWAGYLVSVLESGGQLEWCCHLYLER